MKSKSSLSCRSTLGKEDAAALAGESCAGASASDRSAGDAPEVLATQLAATSLSATQWRALEYLMSGQTVADAARAAGVGRTTLHRWMREDAEFQAAYNVWQKDTASAARSSILALTEPAIRAVAAALEGGDSKTALTVLKSLGLLSMPVPGPTDVEDVRKEQEIERKRTEARLFSDDLAAGM